MSRTPARSSWRIVVAVALSVGLSYGCAEEASLDELDGLWRFTYMPKDGGGSATEDLRITIDGNEVLVTPVEDGQSRVDRRRSGTIDGTIDNFVLVMEESRALSDGCELQRAERTLRGERTGDGRLSGTYSLRIEQEGDACEGGEEQTEVGSFGAVSLE